jgi:hypothetical protein
MATAAQTKLSRFTTLALRLRRLKREYNKALTELQGTCVHNRMVECVEVQMRVCTTCGVAENAYVGYRKLHSNLPSDRLREFIPLKPQQHCERFIRRPE